MIKPAQLIWCFLSRSSRLRGAGRNRGADVSSGYVFERTEGEEERRLEAQARVIDPLTERLFRTAGLEAGLRVLDLGSGAGDVSMLVARIVGSEGAVVGVDASSDALANARSRVELAGLENVRSRKGDVRELDTALNSQDPAHERLQQGKLLGRQMDLGIASTHLARRGIEVEVADLERSRPLGLSAADQRPAAGREARRRRTA